MKYCEFAVDKIRIKSNALKKILSLYKNTPLFWYLPIKDFLVHRVKMSANVTGNQQKLNNSENRCENI